MKESLFKIVATLSFSTLALSANDFPPSGATVRALAVRLRIALDTRLSGHYTHSNMQLTPLRYFHYTIIH